MPRLPLRRGLFRWATVILTTGFVAIAVLSNLDSFGTLSILALPLVWVAVQDFASKTIPDTAVIAILFVALASATAGFEEHLASTLLFSFCIFVFFFILGEVIYRHKGREGLGIGDAKLLGALAPLFDVSTFSFMIFLASVGGIVYALCKGNHETIPFGTFIAVSSFLTLSLLETT